VITTVKDLLRPEVLHTVDGLELVARIVVEGFMSGSNKSQSIGAGQEFSQYRTYEPGDDLRQLDWKVYARSERYYVKQAEIETNITVKFVLDASHSMSFSEHGLSKLDYAKVITAALAYLARKQRDSIGLYAINEMDVQAVHPRFEHQQFLRFLNALIELVPQGTWRKTNGLESLFDHHGKEMIIFITDLYDEQSDLFEFVSRLKTPRNEVVVFHLLGRDEVNLAYPGTVTFEDLESGQRFKVDTSMESKSYSERIKTWIHESRMWMLEKQIAYHLVMLDDPFEQTLRDFLVVRKKLAR
jgi:uncharacterized protein (DUF58 family)